MWWEFIDRVNNMFKINGDSLKKKLYTERSSVVSYGATSLSCLRCTVILSWSISVCLMGRWFTLALLIYLWPTNISTYEYFDLPIYFVGCTLARCRCIAGLSVFLCSESRMHDSRRKIFTTEVIKYQAVTAVTAASPFKIQTIEGSRSNIVQ